MGQQSVVTLEDTMSGPLLLLRVSRTMSPGNISMVASVDIVKVVTDVGVAAPTNVSMTYKSRFTAPWTL